MDFEQARLEKARRAFRAGEFFKAIREASPASQPITANDVIPLAMAIERCSAEEVALWVQQLLAGDAEAYFSERADD